LVDYSLTNSALLESGAVEQVGDGAVADATLIESGASLELDDGATTSATAIKAGGTMDLTAFAYASGGTATLNAADQLVIVEGYQTMTIQLAGNYAGENFHLAGDANSGTLVTVSAAQATDPAALLHQIGGIAFAASTAATHPAIPTLGGLGTSYQAEGSEILIHHLLPHIQ
jgi:autotransporter passenger strand-loop-strand repeat protein